MNLSAQKQEKQAILVEKGKTKKREKNQIHSTLCREARKVFVFAKFIIIIRMKIKIHYVLYIYSKSFRDFYHKGCAEILAADVTST